MPITPDTLPCTWHLSLTTNPLKMVISLFLGGRNDNLHGLGHLLRLYVTDKYGTQTLLRPF